MRTSSLLALYNLGRGKMVGKGGGRRREVASREWEDCGVGGRRMLSGEGEEIFKIFKNTPKEF